MATGRIVSVLWAYSEGVLRGSSWKKNQALDVLPDVKRLIVGDF
jgi:hypothetical protein